MIDEDIPALIPAAVVITATFLAVIQLLAAQAVAWTSVQQYTRAYNTADWVWEQLEGNYKGQSVQAQGYCIRIVSASGATAYDSGASCEGKVTARLAILVNGRPGLLEVRA